MVTMLENQQMGGVPPCPSIFCGFAAKSAFTWLSFFGRRATASKSAICRAGFTHAGPTKRFMDTRIRFWHMDF
jgi:hypothetical protein